MKKQWMILLCVILIGSGVPGLAAAASPTPKVDPSVQARAKERQILYETMQTLTGVPWPYLAAIDQYEQNLRQESKNAGPPPLISIQVPPSTWAGLINPDQEDKLPDSISFFGGIGKDGDGDGVADRHNPIDVLYSVASYLAEKGHKEEQIRERIWDYYRHPTTVDVITHIARIYNKFQTVQLYDRSFPIPLRYNYTYHNTWGDRRGWGGLRIHEGTDIFADYGTPVLSTSYGYVELKGWNRYGGWRIGIRDIYNRYHYFAHLSSFNKGLKKGSIVKPGDVIGYVGSSGYGPPGTSGKFPPHLHYGIYRFNGRNTYSFDPYPLLRRWEREAFKKRRDRKKQQSSQTSSTTTLQWID
ncbi:peptidase M23-like protein [Laceyella sacchari]|uniref:M23 family metallopeptidase n=1 Tax=Laceyella sacchari TaxID=37482 RepID=UPI001050F53E|nr:M23 family metallopeptidase [Laceyella sacchari]TCW40462.1 peptidase M23-like protein [Laceyella sacchari]